MSHLPARLPHARRLAAAAALCAVTALAAPAAVFADASVSMVTGNQFSPGTVTIQVGEKVTWTNNDPAVPHNVKANNGAFDSGVVAGGGGTFSYTFTSAGTFGYICAFHPPGMVGTVVVQAAPAPTQTSGSGGSGGSGGGGGSGGAGGGSPTLAPSSTLPSTPVDANPAPALPAVLALLGAVGLAAFAVARRRFERSRG